MDNEFRNQFPCRVVVDLYCPHKQMHKSARTLSIGQNSLFIVGIPCLRPQSDVVVSFGKPEDAILQIPCQVGLVTLEGVRLDYQQRESNYVSLLQRIIWPKWDGHNILEGLLALACQDDIHDLAGLLRITKIAEEWRKHITPSDIMLWESAHHVEPSSITNGISASDSLAAQPQPHLM